MCCCDWWAEHLIEKCCAVVLRSDGWGMITGYRECSDDAGRRLQLSAASDNAPARLPDGDGGRRIQLTTAEKDGTDIGRSVDHETTTGARRCQIWVVVKCGSFVFEWFTYFFIYGELFSFRLLSYYVSNRSNLVFCGHLPRHRETWVAVECLLDSRDVSHYPGSCPWGLIKDQFHLSLWLGTWNSLFGICNKVCHKHCIQVIHTSLIINWIGFFIYLLVSVCVYVRWRWRHSVYSSKRRHVGGIQCLQCSVLRMLAGCCVWNYATIEVHGLWTISVYELSDFLCFNSVFVLAKYTSNIAVCCDNDVCGVTESHVFRFHSVVK